MGYHPGSIPGEIYTNMTIAKSVQDMCPPRRIASRLQVMGREYLLFDQHSLSFYFAGERIGDLNLNR